MLTALRLCEAKRACLPTIIKRHWLVVLVVEGYSEFRVRDLDDGPIGAAELVGKGAIIVADIACNDISVGLITNGAKVLGERLEEVGGQDGQGCARIENRRLNKVI